MLWKSLISHGSLNCLSEASSPENLSSGSLFSSCKSMFSRRCYLVRVLSCGDLISWRSLFVGVFFSQKTVSSEVSSLWNLFSWSRLRGGSCHENLILWKSSLMEVMAWKNLVLWVFYLGLWKSFLMEVMACKSLGSWKSRLLDFSSRLMEVLSIFPKVFSLESLVLFCESLTFGKSLLMKV